ncbi:DMT family transporter [Herbaspirillum autotrophicum]|uniref:DMT family transporter n=1 Tax=Herbaspirillum autotrophicum TaxID=180195 RepID=UPI0018DE002C|nr:DMT family transporter [Herbaspirillum autotrophicum]
MMPLIQSLAMLLLAVSAGVVVPLQGGVNASLGRGLGHPLWATLVSLLVSIAALLPAMLLLRVPLPTFEFAGKAPFWLWSGGVYGVFFISLTLILMPKLGAGGFIGAAIAGQVLTSLVLDHFGLLGLASKQLSYGRVLGALLLIAGVLLIQFSGNVPAAQAR